MASCWVAFASLVLASLVCLSNADGFLARAEDALITKEDVERTMILELSAARSTHLHSIKDSLRPMFAALPKNEQGRLEPAVVRYALHRFFVQKHGWYMKGLDPAGGSRDASQSSTIMKDRAPAYIQGLFEQHMHGRGLGLHELAVFAAVLADLVHKEASGELHKVFATMNLPTVGPVPVYWAELAVKAYLIGYFAGADMNITSEPQLNFLEQKLMEIYPDWPGTYMWVEDMRQTQQMLLQPSRNPFVPYRETFEDSVSFTQELWHHFGAFQDLECKALKGRLVEIEHQGTGRVRLSRFYAGGVNGDWTLSESVDYLRNLGALDETDPARPSVVISNYLTSQTNCLSASGFYSVCCSDECESLLQHLERDLAAPSVAPERVVALVSALPSDTVHAPRNLSASLRTRLDEIAQYHGGSVPLHGRLFAQWMHHAYPRECPFPHVSGTHSPMSPDAWMSHHGIDNVEATMAEMQQHHARLAAEEEATDGEDLSLPWTAVEEELVGPASRQSSWLSSRLRGIMALATLASFLLPLWRTSRAMADGAVSGNSEKMLV